MAILKETIDGTKILNEISSSNIVRSEYDVETKQLIIEFKNSTKYKYENVPHEIYTRFRMSESQGKFFTTDISRKYKYTKI